MKYFVLADPHSFYNIMMKELEAKGFDINNNEHKVIICGDAFDRGNESIEMFDFIKKLHKQNRLIYIRGNHEDLLLELLTSMNVNYRDVHNGTIGTICQLAKMELEEVLDNFTFTCIKLINEGIKTFIDKTSIDYFETENYIFVHGYIPDEEDWRKGNFYHARWKNGVEYFLNENRKINKTIVCGHFHCNWYRDRNLPKEERWKDFSIQEVVNENNDKIIAIDACTALSKKINVLVIED